MKAIRIEDDESLRWGEFEEPELAPDGVIFEVHATAVNRADLLQRKGRYPVPPGASPIMGLEAAGVISEVGEQVEGWAVGDRVCSLLSGGGYAERVAAPAAHLLRIPPKLSFEEAAALPEVFLTAYLNIYIEADAQPGECLLIHAVASGVGTAAAQLAQQFQNPYIGTASGSKLEQIERWGPARLIDRHDENWPEIVKEVTEGRGVDVILDPVGADYFADNIESLAHRGRLVSIGLLSGASARVDLGRILRNRLRVIGSVLRSRSKEEKTNIIGRFREDVWPNFGTGDLVPVIDRTFPITETEEAHALIATNETVGKVILSVQSPT